MEKSIYTFREQPVPVNALMADSALSQMKRQIKRPSFVGAIVSFPKSNVLIAIPSMGDGVQ